jgi:hypothetical protein
LHRGEDEFGVLVDFLAWAKLVKFVLSLDFILIKIPLERELFNFAGTEGCWSFCIL